MTKLCRMNDAAALIAAQLTLDAVAIREPGEDAIQCVGIIGDDGRCAGNRLTRLSHARWQLKKVQNLVADGSPEEALIMLGAAHNMLWMTGVFVNQELEDIKAKAIASTECMA